MSFTKIAAASVLGTGVALGLGAGVAGASVVDDAAGVVADVQHFGIDVANGAIQSGPNAVNDAVQGVAQAAQNVHDQGTWIANNTADHAHNAVNIGPFNPLGQVENIADYGISNAQAGVNTVKGFFGF